MFTPVHRPLPSPSSSSPPAPPSPPTRPTPPLETRYGPLNRPVSGSASPPPTSVLPDVVPKPSPPLPPKASLSALPRELKLKVIEELHADANPPAKDDPFDRFRRVDDCFRGRLEGSYDFNPTTLDWLSLVNKEFHGLIPGYLCEDVDLRGISRSSLDRLVQYILPAYGSHVRRLRLMDSNWNPLASQSGDDATEALDALLASIVSACPNLEAVHGLATESLHRRHPRTLDALRSRNRLHTLVVRLNSWDDDEEADEEEEDYSDDEDDGEEEWDEYRCYLAAERKERKERKEKKEKEEYVNPLEAIFAAVPRLRHLRIKLRPTNYWLDEPPMLFFSSLDAAVNLRSLSLFDFPPTSFSSMRLPPLLTTLHLRFSEEPDYSTLCHFLNPVAATLQHLSVDNFQYYGEDEPAIAFRLASITHLRLPSFHTPFTYRNHFSYPSLTHFTIGNLEAVTVGALLSIVRTQPTLRVLNAPGTVSGPRSVERTLDELRELCKKRRIQHRLPSFYFQAERRDRWGGGWY